MGDVLRRRQCHPRRESDILNSKFVVLASPPQRTARNTARAFPPYTYETTTVTTMTAIDTPAVTEASLKKLKVTELREKLAEESLETKGVKDELVKRLLEHFESKKTDAVATDAPAAAQAPTAEAPEAAGAPNAAAAPMPAPTAAVGTSEQDKAAARAARFGIPQKETKEPEGSDEKKEQLKKKGGGIGGLGDVDRKEEFERRKKRAERFGLPIPIDSEAELEKKKARAERFGMPAPPPSAQEVAAKLKAREERFGGAK